VKQCSTAWRVRKVSRTTCTAEGSSIKMPPCSSARLMPQEACVLFELTSPRPLQFRRFRKPNQMSLENMCFSCLPPPQNANRKDKKQT
jgi:hypothetical protein